jgi:hypothetical protein
MRFLLETISKIKAKINHNWQIRGILGTMYNQRTLHAKKSCMKYVTCLG